MGKVLITEQYLFDIADTIRSKLGVSDLYKPEEMASAIESITGGGSVSELVDNPKYFYTECVDTAQKINNLRNDHTFVMYFITDSHVYTSNNNLKYLNVQLASMNAVAKMIKPDLVVHGGDMTNGSEAKEQTIAFTDHIVSCMKEIGGNNTQILIGNHDGNTVQSSLDNEEQRITEAEMLEMYRSWNDGFTYAGNSYQGGQFYGYKDYNDIGLRVIRLHSYIEDIGNPSATGGMGGNWGYYADEVTWFTNIALNTDNTILIICHQTLSPILQGYPESQDIPHRGTILQQAIDSWLNANSSHRCAGVIHGHVHWDFSAKGKNTFTVIDHSTKNQISRTGSYGNFYEHGMCFCNYMPSFSTVDSTPSSSYRDIPIGAIFRGRTINTATQGLWTAIIVDTQAETVNTVRFGAGNDNSYYYGETLIPVTGVTLSEHSGSLKEGAVTTLIATVVPSDASVKTVSWTSSDTNVATVVDGQIVAISEGTATITVHTIDGGYTDNYELTVTSAEALPTGYTKLKWVTADGNQYINTNIPETTNLAIEYTCSVYADSLYGTGGHVLSSQNVFYPFLRSTSDTKNHDLIVCNRKNGGGVEHNFSWAIGSIYTFKAFDNGENDVYVNNTRIFSQESGATSSANNYLYLFAYGGNPSTAYYRFNGNLYSMKLYDFNGNLIHNYIPCINPDNIVGLYDVIAEKFLHSESGTELIAEGELNWLKLAQNEDGTLFNNGQGWKSGYRLNSSGVESASSSNQVTGFIPIIMGKTITLTGIELPATNYDGYNTCYIAVYDSTHTCIKSNYSKDWYAMSNNVPKSADSNNYIVTITFNEGVAHYDISEMAYIRISTLNISNDAEISIK